MGIAEEKASGRRGTRSCSTGSAARTGSATCPRGPLADHDREDRAVPPQSSRRVVLDEVVRKRHQGAARPGSLRRELQHASAPPVHIERFSLASHSGSAHSGAFEGEVIDDALPSEHIRPADGNGRIHSPARGTTDDPSSVGGTQHRSTSSAIAKSISAGSRRVGGGFEPPRPIRPLRPQPG
jgi:hypothetical protein